MPDEDGAKLSLERIKLAVDIAKHIATLSAGSILVTATFLDKFKGPITGRWLVAGAILFFVISLMSSVVYLDTTTRARYWRSGGWDGLSRSWSGTLTMQSFVLGVIFLAAFACLNIVLASYVSK